ncbi:MAG: dephospho-CoA kinase [Clostridiaceae bacterium]
MIRIGVTGGIASGKTTIVNYLKCLGLKVIDADLIAREVLDLYPEIMSYLKVTYGDQVIKNGILDRKALGNIIFNSIIDRKNYNDVIMPRIREEVDKRFQELENESFVVLDAPLLFEEKFEEETDVTITIYVDKYTQLKRLMKRDNLTEKEALTRIEAQMDISEKIKKSDFVVNNSGDLTDTITELSLVLKKVGFIDEKKK